MNDELKQLDLDAIKGRLAKATPGPWHSESAHESRGHQPIITSFNEGDYYIGDDYRGPDDEAAFVATTFTEEIDELGYALPLDHVEDDDIYDSIEQADANAAFIAHARTDIAALVAEVERLNAERRLLEVASQLKTADG